MGAKVMVCVAAVTVMLLAADVLAPNFLSPHSWRSANLSPPEAWW